MLMAGENNLSLRDTQYIGLLMLKSVLQLFFILKNLQDYSRQYCTERNMRIISNSQPVYLYVEAQ